jgi:isochorismate pyruvate lyase
MWTAFSKVGYLLYSVGKRVKGDTMELDDIRLEIDTIDRDIVGLLARRAECVERAGALKVSDYDVRAPSRVEQVIRGIRDNATDSGLEPDIAEKIYHTIIDCFIQKELQVFGMKDYAGEDSSGVRVFQMNDIPLRPNVPGASMWAVALDRSMLTYFELEPGAIFPEHSHEAEQITLVTDGELIFSYDDRTVTLGPGDVVAIPSNVRHSARTGATSCRAIDAWSPPREDFLPER